MKPFFNWIRRYLLMIATFAILLAALFYYLYRHWEPFTQNAFVTANTRPVSAIMEGYVTDIRVRNNQFVKKGDPLFTTFQPPYQLKVTELEHEIEAKRAALRGIGARTGAAEAEVRRLQAMLKNETYLSDTANYMYNSAAVSQAYTEERLRSKQALEAQLEGALFSVKALKHDGEMTAALIKQLEARLELAKINRGLTVVRALSDGYVTNMSVSPGGYYHAGDVLFGFIDTETWWVQANFKESELSGIRKGQTARIWLWQYPGGVLKGVVEETGWSAERRKTAPETGLPVVEKENEWFLLPQRFPVQIRIVDPPAGLLLTPGGSAYVSINTPARPIRQFFWQLFLWD